MKLSFTFITCLLIVYAADVLAQGSHKYTHGRLAAYTDSLKATPYPYVLPILGTKVQKLGFDIPRPFGVMLNLVTGSQELTIDRLSVSTDDNTYIDVSNIVNFTKVEPHINVISLRPDIWLLPFLNVSGLVGSFNSTTDVWLDQPADMKFVAHNQGTIAGFGVMLAGGLGPLFVTYQYNGTWSFTEKLFNPNYTSLNGFRIGHQHKNHKRPQSSWSVWTGAESMVISKNSRGVLNLNDLTGISQEDKQNASEQLDVWFNDLPLFEQELLQPVYERMTGWLNNGEDALLYYDFDKNVEQQWNILAGGQYQINKNWQVMFESSFVGSRWRTVLSGAYRFGIK